MITTKSRWISLLGVSAGLLCGCGCNPDPIADAGADQNADVGQRVTLNGLPSTDVDGDPLTYSWGQTMGPVVSLTNPNGATTQFVPAEDGTYEFVLTVTDDRGGSDRDTVRVFVNTGPVGTPVADPGTDQTVDEGEVVTLRGDNSSDPNGDPLSYDWDQLSGPDASLSNPFVAKPTFTAPEVDLDQQLVFMLTVEDPGGLTDADTVVITVRDVAGDDFCEENGLYGNGICNEDCPLPDPDCEEECTDDIGCDDGLFCNGLETCVGGVCQAGDDPCPGQLCDESDDVCGAIRCDTDADCDDGDACTGDSCVDGVCSYTVVDCDDGDACTTDTCDASDPFADPDTGCVNAPVDCSAGRTCIDGVCVACIADADCDDGDLCTTDTCTAGVCSNAAADCGAGFVCIPETGECVACIADADCDDDDPCTTDTCSNGSCSNAQIPGCFEYSLQPLGSGMNGSVGALTVYDSDLIAGGGFSTAGGSDANNIARWDGQSWSPLGIGVDLQFDNEYVSAMTVYSGELIVGGRFDSAGGSSANSIARWNGTVWQPLGSGLDGWVHALTVDNNDLIVGGTFDNAGGSPASNVARWSGTEWQPLGSGLDGCVCALTVYNGQLVAGGSFNIPADGSVIIQKVAYWNGESWQPLGSGVVGSVDTLTVYDTELIAGGLINYLNSLELAVYWNGAIWQPMPISGFIGAGVSALTVYDNELIAGGSFYGSNGLPPYNIARWGRDGTTWTISEELGVGLNGTVNALTVYNTELIAGGEFTIAEDGSAILSHIAKWAPAP